MSQQSPERAEQQVEATTARVLAILAAFRAGQLSTPDLTRGVAVAVYAGKVLASRLADIEISTALNRPPVGVQPGPQHLDRLAEAVETVLEDVADPEPDEEPEPEDPAPRLERLATSEVLESHSRSLAATIHEQGEPQWREEVAPDACEECQPYADQLHDSEEAFEPHHPNCRCYPVLVGEPEPEPTPEPEPEPLFRITYENA